MIDDEAKSVWIFNPLQPNAAEFNRKQSKATERNGEERMQHDMTAFDRLENILQHTGSVLDDEISDCVRAVRVQLETSHRESKRLADAQADAIIDSAEIIIQLKEAEHDLHRLKREAEEANTAKSQFLANMSHEMRTPLSGILGFTRLLLEDADAGDPKARQDYLKTIHRNSENLLALINDILDLSKIEAGQLVIERIPCQPNQVIAEVASLLRVPAQEKNLTIEALSTGGVLAQIVSDPMRIRQLLINLIGNAIKFTEKGGVRVISRFFERDNNARFEVEVADTGVGIPADKLKGIFEPFTQADGTVTRKYGGTGLGLAISRRLAKALGGSLLVKSDLGAGSVFTLEIDAGRLCTPQACQQKIHATPVEIYRQASPEPSPVTSLSGRILVVDDSHTNRKLIELLLRRVGAEVVTAENGQQAVDLALNTSFDLIYMDMQMPVLDGYQATAQIRKNGANTPILALTAHAMQGDEQKCRNAGCSGYLTKPIDFDRLLSSASEILGGSGTETEQPSQEPVSPRCEQSLIVSSLPTDDPEFREIVEEFISRFRSQLHVMQDAWKRGNLEELAQLAHWLKGSGGTAGFDDLTKPAKQLENFAKNGTRESIPDTLEELESLALRIVASSDA